MARSEMAEIAKGKVWEAVEEVAGAMRPVSRRRKDWRVSDDGGLSVFVTFSRDDQRFFDVNKDDLAQWLSYPRAFVGFVMGDHQEVFFVPAREMARRVEALRPTTRGNFKLHIIERSDGYEFREVPGLGLLQFLNTYSRLKE